jgi:iron complex outermembrane receptor protein
MKDVNWVNDLKLRLGYGITGQQEGIADYAHLAQYVMSDGYEIYYPVGGENNAATLDKNLDHVDHVTDQNGNELYFSYRPKAYNQDLTWEKTTTYNAGIDFSFLNNRISGALDYYYRVTDDLLNVVPVAAGTNFRNKVVQNVGSLTNQGIEFSINAVVLDYGRRFKWDLGYNVTWNQNRITRLNTGEDQTPIPTGGIGVGMDNNVQRHAVGQPISSFYVYETKQAVRDNGEKYWYFVDKTGDGLIDENDKRYFHSAAAPVTMGFQMKFQFYDFDLGMSFRASIGNYLYNNVKASNLLFVPGSMYNQTKYMRGLIATSFAAYNADNVGPGKIYMNEAGTGSTSSEWYFSDYFVENASFLRCDNITLGWSFQRPKISGRVYATVSNPFVLSKYSGLDPEIFGGIDSSIYPRSMTTVLGVNLQF